MIISEVLSGLEQDGSAANRRLLGERGVCGKAFGVDPLRMHQWRARIGTDHALAQQLWHSENHDARLLACMIADSGAWSAAALDLWAGAIDNPLLVHAFASMVAGTVHAEERLLVWVQSPSRWLSLLGWKLVAMHADQTAAGRDPRAAADQTAAGRDPRAAVDPTAAGGEECYAALLRRLPQDFVVAEEQVREAMRLALAAIGRACPALADEAGACGESLGLRSPSC